MVFGNLSSMLRIKEWSRSISHMVTGSIISFFYIVASPFVYKWISKENNPPSIISLVSLLGYNYIYLIPTALVRFVVGKKIDFLVSVIGGLIAGYSNIVKLNAFYNDSTANQNMKSKNLIF